MTMNDRVDEYLWDPAAPPDRQVLAIESSLSAARFDPERRPLQLPERRAGSAAGWPLWRSLAAAAALILVAGAGYAAWRWSWPDNRPWFVAAAPAGSPARLPVGSRLDLSAGETALVDVARIGTMRVSGGSSVTLRATASNRHLLSLDRGSVHVRVWAPPFSVVFQTPAGEVRDVGCEFQLEVDGSEVRVRVVSGWVQLDNLQGEILVPAGASSEMITSRRPGVPVFDDAVPGFREAVRRLEAAPGDAAGVVDRVAALARPRDVLTLLHLVNRGVPARHRLVEQAAELWPPPNLAIINRVLQGDDRALWEWRDSLPLPPVKGWWRNWRDALPLWLLDGNAQ
jgi:hypothetical protein